jgi:hypothetical protein
MAEIRWTAEAGIWLREIYDYIAADNPTAAASTIECSGIYKNVFSVKKQIRKY